MTIAEYEAILLDLIERKKITIDEATELLKRFQAGDFEEEDLPLSIAEAIRKEEDDTLLLPFFSLLPRPEGKRIRLNNRKHKRELAMGVLATNIGGIAESYTSGETTLHQWQSDTMAIIGGSIAAQWVIGNGTGRDSAQVDKRIEEQYGYLYRFAAENHAASALGRPVGEDGMLRRMLMYGGAAWAAWFVGNESVSQGDGYVIFYQSRDDRGTCGPCRAAQGYYLPGRGPMPGQVCFGGYLCRCERILMYAPEIYASL